MSLQLHRLVHSLLMNILPARITSPIMLHVLVVPAVVVGSTRKEENQSYRLKKCVVETLTLTRMDLFGEAHGWNKDRKAPTPYILQ